jgi:hypothetical protein
MSNFLNSGVENMFGIVSAFIAHRNVTKSLREMEKPPETSEALMGVSHEFNIRAQLGQCGQGSFTTIERNQ